MTIFTVVKETIKTKIMRDLNKFREVIEEEVNTFLESYDDDRESISQEIDIDFEIDGVEYSATVEVDASFDFVPNYEYDIYDIEVYVGSTPVLESSEFYIKHLWDNEIEEYIIEDYKQTDKW